MASHGSKVQDTVHPTEEVIGQPLNYTPSQEAQALGDEYLQSACVFITQSRATTRRMVPPTFNVDILTLTTLTHLENPSQMCPVACLIND